MIEAEWFIAADERPIFHRALVPENPRGILILCHGYAEHSGRFIDLMKHFASLGLAVFAEDHRGHGRTARTLGDIESFDAVLSDLAILHRNALTRLPGLPVFLFGHSMGGLIAVLYAQRNPDLAGAIFQSAGIDVPDDANPLLVKAAGLLGRYLPRLPVEPFYDPSQLCRNPAILANVELDPLFYKGKMRARMANEFLTTIPKAIRGLEKLTLPMLVTHGTKDEVVHPRASEVLYGGAPSKDKTLTLFEGWLHELHNEPERDEVFAAYADWLEERL